MALYRVHFLNHGGNAYGTEYIDCLHDEAAIKKAHLLYVAAFGTGFDVWHGERLVHQHRQSSSG